MLGRLLGAVLRFVAVFERFGGFWFVFSDSLAFSASIPLFFVPKYPLGHDFGPKQRFLLKEDLPKTLGGGRKVCLSAC